KPILAKIDAGEEMILGALGIARVRDTAANVTQQIASGWVARTTAAKFALPVSGPQFGFCRIYDRTYAVGGFDPSFPNTFLDAGISLQLSGSSLPAGLAIGKFGFSYGVMPTNSYAPGLYTLAGNGGAQVGAFNVSINFPESFNVTNWDSITAI